MGRFSSNQSIVAYESVKLHEKIILLVGDD